MDQVQETTEVKKKKEPKKTSFVREFEALKGDYTNLGDLKRKLKGVKSGAEKSDIRNRHAYQLNNIKKAIKVLKTDILKHEDIDTYRKLLTWERQRNIISVPDEYILNKMEADSISEETCECFNAPPAGLRCELGGKYKHYSYFDEARQKDMYVTYMPVVIQPEEQIGRELEWKISQGFHPKVEDYPQAKTLWKRRVLVDSEWRRYFREF